MIKKIGALSGLLTAGAIAVAAAVPASASQFGAAKPAPPGSQTQYTQGGARVRRDQQRRVRAGHRDAHAGKRQKPK
jgi:hypothetical protein